MLNTLLQSLALTFFLPSSQAQDLLGLFQPKANLPQELNDFLSDVQQHKKDFTFIRHALKNQEKYGENYQEASGLLVEDVAGDTHNNNNFRYVNELHSGSDITGKNSGEDNSFSDLFEEEDQRPPYNEDGSIYAGFEPPRFKKHYPNERYSRNIHSPIRLRRELEKGFRSEHKLDVNSNGRFSYKRTRDRKYPIKSQGANHVMKVDEDNATKKKKREVEISITSNGKSMNQIEEDEHGPECIVLNIKTDSPSGPDKPLENSTLTKNNYPSPETNENIPNIADNHQNNVPMNFLGAKNNLESSRTLDEVLSEVRKASTSHQVVGEPLNTTYNYLKLSAKNNFSCNKLGLEYDLDEDQEDNFEKIQSLEVDGTGVSQAKEKLVTRKDQGYDYFDPQDLMSLEAGLTKNVLHTTTPGGATSKKQKAENILRVENTQCRPPEEELLKIIRNKENCEDGSTETIRKPHEHSYNQRRTTHSGEKQTSFRHRKPPPRVAKHKRKRVRQHPKKKVRLDHEVDYYNLDLLYEPPKKAFKHIPSYRRGLKEIDYDYNPHAIQDVGSNSQTVRKKFKTEGDYSEEEDMMSPSAHKKMPVKKTQNQFAMDGNEGTTEENDDDYDYSELTDMENEDEDVSFEEVDNDKLDIDEAADNKTESEHDVRENIKKLVEATSEQISSGSVIKSIDDMRWEPDQVLAGAHSHRGGRTRTKNRKRRVVIESRDKSNGIRGKRAPAGEKLKRKERRRRKGLKAKQGAPSRDSEQGQFQQKPLTDQEKQDIFLRYNPDFQRWPRFIQGNQKFHDMTRRRGVEDYQKYRRQDFVKREEPTSETAASSLSQAGSDLQSAATEDSSSAASSSSSNDEGASTSNDESPTSSDSPNGETKAAGSEAEAVSNGAVETLPPQVASSDDDGLTVDAVLMTANSDIFGNVTVPELGAEQRGNDNTGNAAGGTGSTVAEFETTEETSNSTELPLNTIAEGLTQIRQSKNMNQGQVKPFEDAKHSHGTVTSVLPLAKEAATESLNLTKEEFLDLDDILVGMLPKDVVLESLSTARGRIRNGLKFASHNVNLANFPLSTLNSSEESSMLFLEISNLLKKLKYHSACQALPTNLRTYLKTITRNEMDDPMAKLKEMNEIDLDNRQSSYMFHSEQNDEIYERAQVLRELLRKYQNLSADGKKRVEPVKKYIESHLAMIEQMGGDKAGEPTAPPIARHSSAEPKEEKGISAANVDEEVKLRAEMKEEGTAFTSPQFGKLVKAVRNVRSGRQVIKRIGEIYGRNALDRSKEDRIRSKDKGFESPRIINF